jgi:hypothetical protein
MTTDPRAKLFDDHEPALNTDEIISAGNSGARVVSLKVLPFLMPDKTIRYIGQGNRVKEMGDKPVAC